MIGTRPLGSTGLTVSEIGLGTWQLGRSSQWPDGPDPDEAVRLVHAAIDAGITFLDTAPGYADGESEPTLARALGGGRRDRVVLCTKVGHLPDGSTDWSVGNVEGSVRRSLQRLSTDRLDVVVLHNPPADVLDGTTSEHYAALERLREQGLVRAYGASVDTSADVDTVVRTTASRALEVRLSALYQETWDAVGRAGDAGVGTIVKVPLESGWLAGRHTAESVFTDVRSRWSREDVAYRARLVDDLRTLLPPGVPLLHAALRFVLAHPRVSTVIPGVKSVRQLEDVVAAAAEPLPDDVVAAVRAFHRERLEDAPLDW